MKKVKLFLPEDANGEQLSEGDYKRIGKLTDCLMAHMSPFITLADAEAAGELIMGALFQGTEHDSKKCRCCHLGATARCSHTTLASLCRRQHNFNSA